METGSRLIAARGKGDGENGGKKGEGISQRTCMNNPWTCKGGKIGTTVTE